jgi:Domain of unknown function (DUF4430)
MRAAAALAVLALCACAAVVAARASGAVVNVRIEGRSETLFEGPVLTEGHNVRAASDSKAPPGGRRCDGLNNGQYPTPGPTPTAAAADAMGILGEDFDGTWYAAPFEDYFITRWGPDGQDEANGEYWGLMVNNVFTSVGGCQYQLDAGDEVVWAYDAFDTRPLLALFPAGYAGDARPLTAIAEAGESFGVEVDVYERGLEGTPPPSPERRGASPFAGAEVAPVGEGGGGFESVEVDDPAAVTTGDDGQATVVFAEPGWHRLKATVGAAGGDEEAIRSNRLDVCVPDPPAADCGPPPGDDLVRIPPPVETEAGGGEAPWEGRGPEPSPAAGTGSSEAGGTTGARRIRVCRPRIDRHRIGRRGKRCRRHRRRPHGRVRAPR